MIKYNFSPGPAKLNNSVLEIVNKNIIEYQEEGISILEISHRSDSFEKILRNNKKEFNRIIKDTFKLSDSIPSRRSNISKYFFGKQHKPKEINIKFDYRNLGSKNL